LRGAGEREFGGQLERPTSGLVHLGHSTSFVLAVYGRVQHDLWVIAMIVAARPRPFDRDFHMIMGELTAAVCFGAVCRNSGGVGTQFEIWLRDICIFRLAPRGKQGRTYLNLIVTTMILAGLWNGAKLDVSVFGAIHGGVFESSA